ncbi:MAG: undecaprenyl/decaprenyl-phosphate alpha-N-acetylglucosaminyl 1-phosphate transferase [Candidatus Brocadiae bacterium]|nr:undecaprenyl/decaprenyl-phosphate alpha-N-acetylglucosaminyl 1-phosphate transferase [Candidatus Brocadiia bacterium]
MTTCLVAFGLALLVGLAATLAVRKVALRLGVVDRPDEFRKVHQREVPLLGGIAIYVGFATPVALCFFHRNVVTQHLYQRPAELAALMAGAAMVLAMGVIDDAWGLPARWKLTVQAAAASVAFAGGFSIGLVSNPFGEPVALGLLSLPVTLFWFLGCMNAVNLLDGLDGLAAGVCLFASVTLFLVSLLFGHVLIMLLMACLSGAILGFLLFNFHPASVFLGDSGSMVLGFLVGALSLWGARKAEATVALLIPCIALGLPIFDTVLAIVRRWLRRLPIAAPDRGHVHHVLLSMGLSHRQAVLVLYVVCVVLGGAALLVTAGRNELTLLVLGSLAILAFVCVRVFGGMQFLDLWGRLAGEWTRRHRAAEAKISVERAISRMQAVTSTNALWGAFCAGLEGLDLDFAVLQLFAVGQSRPHVLTWPEGRHPAPDRRASEPESWSARLRVQSNGRTFGELELGKCIEGGLLLSDAPELVDRLKREMATNMERLSALNVEDAAPPPRAAVA